MGRKNSKRFVLTTPWQAFVDALFAVLLVIILVTIIFIVYKTFYEDYYDIINKEQKKLELNKKEDVLFNLRNIEKADNNYELFDINEVNNKLTATVTFYNSLLSEKMHNTLIKYVNNSKNIETNIHYNSKDINNTRVNLYNHIVKLISNINKDIKVEVLIKLHQDYDKKQVIVEFTKTLETN